MYLYQTCISTSANPWAALLSIGPDLTVISICTALIKSAVIISTCMSGRSALQSAQGMLGAYRSGRLFETSSRPPGHLLKYLESSSIVCVWKAIAIADLSGFACLTNHLSKDKWAFHGNSEYAMHI